MSSLFHYFLPLPAAAATATFGGDFAGDTGLVTGAACAMGAAAVSFAGDVGSLVPAGSLTAVVIPVLLTAAAPVTCDGRMGRGCWGRAARTT